MSLTTILKNIPPRTPAEKLKANRDVKIKKSQKKRSWYSLVFMRMKLMKYSGSSILWLKINLPVFFIIMGSTLKKREETNV